MKILVVGGGGREHALCWAIAKSPLLGKLYCAPGNAGIAGLARRVDIAADDTAGLLAFARAKAIDFVVIGPETPLVLGLADDLAAAGIKAFGPSAAAARLEGSKGFMKDLCRRHAIPTADYGRFTEARAAHAHIDESGGPVVVKADGLAAGKGVILCRTAAEAHAAVDRMMDARAFGEAGAEIVIEEFLQGEEASFFVLVDGETALPLVSAQDHKAAYDGGRGPNTGGMGAYSPAPVVTPDLIDTVMETIIKPTIAGMKGDGTPYRGVLYAGLMITEAGPKLLEYNVRFGDPECQAMMARLKSDIVPALLATNEGGLDAINLDWSDDAAMTVVMAAKGYPGDYQKNTVIGGLEAAGNVPGVTVFHAGTSRQDGQIVATGGRVLGVTATAATVAEARARAYEAVGLIDWPDGFWRRDIGWRAVARQG